MRNTLTTLIFFMSCLMLAQVRHKVALGETIYKLSKQYKVTIQEIFQANPGLKDKPLKIDKIILIPREKVTISDAVAEKDQVLTHQVQSGETLYVISKKYGISIETLVKENPHLSQGLKQGDILSITPKNTERSVVSNQSNTQAYNKKSSFYQVQAKETLYGISRRLGVSQEELQKINLNLKNGLKKGMTLRLPVKKDSVRTQESIPNKSPLKTSVKDPGYDDIIYIIKEGDTMFSIMRNYDISLEDLLNHNPELKKGLKAGMELKISTNKRITYKVAPTQDGINIVLMLPLLAQETRTSELSKHAISFYLGAKYAIDTIAKKEKIYIKVFDTENNKSKIEKFLDTYDFLPIHAVIGPFFRSSVEKVARALKNEKIPVISPLTASEALDIYPNVVQAEVKDQYLVEPIVEEIKRLSSSAQTVYLVVAKKAKPMAQYLKSLLSNRQTLMRVIEIDELLNIPTDTSPFFTVLLGEDPVLGQSFIKGVQNFEPSQVIPLGVGYNEVYYKNIALLKKYRFVFTVKYHTNKNEATTQQTLDELHKKFDQAPDKYKLLGFDLTFDLLERLLKHRKLLHHLPGKESARLVAKYHYEKLPSGGYANKGVWLIRLRSSTVSDVLKD
ncbi:MAG: LysM peptidoglycan-binding domain-containing protein [Flavobacteriales bacterium AspAUS03]